MGTRPPREPGLTLPRDRAFVVQVAAAGGGTAASLTGRVEHVASGQAARFETAEECLAFIARVLSA